jgi:hypothetical protein
LFESTIIQTNQHFIKRTNIVQIHNNSNQPTSHEINNNGTTPSQKKTRDAIGDSNLTWIKRRNYHAKNMSMTNPNEWDLIDTTDAISPPFLHKELESKEIHITTMRMILPKIIEKHLQRLLQKANQVSVNASKYNYFVTNY